MKASAIRVLSVVVCFVAACGGGGGDGGGGGPPTTGAVRINNYTGYTIHETYAAPSSSSDWGPVQNSAPIPASSSFTLTDLPPGVWDFQAVSVGAYSPYFSYAWDVPLDAGDLLVFDTYADDFTGSLSVYNDYAYAITELYVSPTSSPTWGANQLSAAVVPGDSSLLYDVDPDAYDVRCVHSDGAYSDGTWSIVSFSVTSIVCG